MASISSRTSLTMPSSLNSSAKLGFVSRDTRSSDFSHGRYSGIRRNASAGYGRRKHGQTSAVSRKSPRPGNVQGNANPDSRKARRAAPLKRKKPANYTQRIAVFGRFATTSSLETRSGGGGTGAPGHRRTGAAEHAPARPEPTGRRRPRRGRRPGYAGTGRPRRSRGSSDRSPG